MFFTMKVNFESLRLKLASLAVMLLLFAMPVTDSARILGLFATPAPSHNYVFQALMKRLAERGHTVEVVSPCPLSSPPPANYKDVVLPELKTDKLSLMKFLVSKELTPLKEQLGLWQFSKPLCEAQLSSPEIQKYLAYDPKDPSSPKFDLVIVEMFFFDCMLGFAHHFDAPLVAMVSQYSIPWGYDAVGAPKLYSSVPNWFLHYGRKMSFFERLYNAVFTIGIGLFRWYVALPSQDGIARRYFDPKMPPLWEIEGNTSLVLFNGHPAVSPIHPSLPNLVDVAGMHIQANPPPLLMELQELMDKHKKVILFSLGSNIDGQVLGEERLTTIMKALKEIPCQILWRWTGKIEELPIPVPSNVYIMHWLPQQSLLAHPNLVGFVTHGGLLSIQETVYHGVPIVGFPFFGDQFLNMNLASESGFGISLDFHSFNKDDLVSAVTDILTNESYTIAAKEVSTIFRDQPETPLERGVYWTEYIIRHKGAPHLQSAAKHLNWFQYYLVDVFTFIFTILIIIIFLIYYVCRILKVLFFRSSRKSKKD